MTFDEFQAVTSKQWKQKIQFELEGEDFNSEMVWTSNEGIEVKPFYHRDDKISEVPILHNANNWKICHTIYVHNEISANKKAQWCLKHGADSLHFILPKPTLSISKLLDQLDHHQKTIYLNPLFLDQQFLSQLKVLAISQKHNLVILNDPIGHLARSGNWYNNQIKDLDILNQYCLETDFKSVISIDGNLYHNAGANMTYQLALILAHANEYLNHCPKIDSKTIVFKIAVGSNYFFEIAKLQAFRWLWQSLMKTYNLNIDSLIITTPSKRNKTIYDYNNNLLRTTTESMSAILGSSDVIMTKPYDYIYKKTNIYSERLALNQLLILKHESFFDNPSNPTQGAYYIESLTKQLAEKALDIFKNIEKKGGFLKELKFGKIQKKIQEQASKEQHLYDSQKEGLVGIHIQPEYNKGMKNQIELYPFLKKKSRKTLIAPILEKRIAASEENRRIAHE